MKKNTKTKSEPKSERASLLVEHDNIVRQLAKLKKAADASDAKNSKAVATAEAVCAAAVKKASAAAAAAVDKAGKVNNAERDAIAKQNGPLKRRLLFLKSEVRREFATGECSPLQTGPILRSFRRSVNSSWERSLPEGEWVTRPGSVWERKRSGEMIELRSRTR